eukprot:Opistho-1_new@49477
MLRRECPQHSNGGPDGQSFVRAPQSSECDHVAPESTRAASAAVQISSRKRRAACRFVILCVGFACSVFVVAVTFGAIDISDMGQTHRTVRFPNKRQARHVALTCTSVTADFGPSYQFARVEAYDTSEGHARTYVHVAANDEAEGGTARRHKLLMENETVLIDIARWSLRSPSSTAKAIVLDVGANSGVFGLLGAARGLESHLFEPNSACVTDILRATIRNGFCKHVFVHPLAVSSGDFEDAHFRTRRAAICRHGDAGMAPGTVNRTLGRLPDASGATPSAAHMQTVPVVGIDDAVAAIALRHGRSLRLGERRARRPGVLPNSDSDGAVASLPRGHEQRRPIFHFLIAFVRIGVDGHEPAVLLGMLRSVRAHLVSNALVELTPTMWGRYGFTLGQGAAIMALVCAEGAFYAASTAGSTLLHFGTSEAQSALFLEGTSGDSEAFMTTDSSGELSYLAALQLHSAIARGMLDMPTKLNVWLSRDPTISASIPPLPGREHPGAGGAAQQSPCSCAGGSCLELRAFLRSQGIVI